MANQICFQCFKIKGDYEVCPHCGYVENTKAEQVYQLAPGTILHNRYIIGTSIGIGGFGITYKAFDTALSVVVAVKEFYPAGLVNRGEGEVKVGIFSGDKEGEFRRQLARFLEEARNMAAFSKEKDIVNVYDYFEENQTAYIIMEYVDAPLLKEKLKEQGRFPEQEATGYMLAILDALAKIHKNGIIHKDISPDNIFLTGPDTIKIFDFGAAKFQETETERTEVVVVKAGYTPPEQYRSKNEQGFFMDIYAAGAVYYEMVTGEKPMDAPDRAEKDELKKPSECGVPVEEWVERVILKALALRPELRFQTAGQFKNAILNKKKVELPEQELKRKQRQRRALAIGSAAVFIIVGGIVILWQTVFSGRGKIDVSQIKEDTVEVWLLAEDEEAGEELSEAFLEDAKEKCPQLDVTVKAFGAEEYQKAISQETKDGGGSLPDVFCTDGLDAERYCADSSDLLHTMDLSSYLYLDGLEGKAYEIPTAMQVGVAYVNSEKEMAFGGQEEVELTTEKPSDKFGYADDEAALLKAFQYEASDVCAVIGDLSDMDSVREVTVDKMPPTDFRAIPVLQDRKPIGRMEYCYGVNKDIPRNRQEAGMYLISLLLSDRLQGVAYMDNDAGIPLNRDVLKDYEENKLTTYLAFLKEYDLEDVRLVEDGDICQAVRERIAGNGK